MKKLFSHIDFLAECRESGLSLWECPPFLFIVMGLVNIGSIILTYIVANRYEDQPEITALLTLLVAAVIFIIGNAIIFGFSKIVEANAREAEFIGIISHQLRSPLSIFKWTLGSLMSDTQRIKAPKEIGASLDTLTTINQRMIQLVSMLLEVHRIESNRFVIKKNTIDIKSITENIIKDQKQYAHSFGISLSLRAPSLRYPLIADEDKVQMVIQNLTDNALRYADQNSTVCIDIEKVGDAIRWEVTNTGIGIPKEEHARIFQKFYRAKNAITYQVEGNGIGLYVAKTIIAQHGGIIGFSSEGKKTIFWFTLPIAGPDAPLPKTHII